MSAGSITTQEIIYSALRKTGEFDQSEAVPGEDYANAELAFTLICGDLAVRGADLFTRKQITLFLQKDQQSYSLGATDHFTESYVETSVSADEDSGQTEISVASETGLTVADNIGIKLDDGTTHWSTVASLGPLVISDALPSAASSGAKVYAYTTKASRPQKLLRAFRRDISNIDTQVGLIGEDEYYKLSTKGSSGPVNQIWYHPTLTTGTLYVWPTDGGSSVDKLIVSAQMLPSEFPVEWGNPLVWLLASEMAAEYGLPLQERAYLRSVSEKKLKDVLDYDVENADVIFTMDGP